MNKVTKTAPKIIYLQVSDDPYHVDEPFPENLEGVTWCQDSATDCEVKYVRADIVGMTPEKANHDRLVEALKAITTYSVDCPCDDCEDQNACAEIAREALAKLSVG